MASHEITLSAPERGLVIRVPVGVAEGLRLLRELPWPSARGAVLGALALSVWNLAVPLVSDNAFMIWASGVGPTLLLGFVFGAVMAAGYRLEGTLGALVGWGGLGAGLAWAAGWIYPQMSGQFYWYLDDHLFHWCTSWVFRPLVTVLPLVALCERLSRPEPMPALPPSPPALRPVPPMDPARAALAGAAGLTALGAVVVATLGWFQLWGVVAWPFLALGAAAFFTPLLRQSERLGMEHASRLPLTLAYGLVGGSLGSLLMTGCRVYRDLMPHYPWGFGYFFAHFPSGVGAAALGALMGGAMGATFGTCIAADRLGARTPNRALLRGSGQALLAGLTAGLLVASVAGLALSRLQMPWYGLDSVVRAWMLYLAPAFTVQLVPLLAACSTVFLHGTWDPRLVLRPPDPEALPPRSPPGTAPRCLPQPGTSPAW